MAKAKSRAVARRVKDKWKSKNWYKLYAPQMFNQAEIGEILGDEPEQLIGRIATVSMQDLTGDFSKMHIKLSFKISDVRSMNAYTQFNGHDLTSDYTRKMTRRKKSKTDAVFDVRTKDGYVVRVKAMAIGRSSGGRHSSLIHRSIHSTALETNRGGTVDMGTPASANS